MRLRQRLIIPAMLACACMVAGAPEAGAQTHHAHPTHTAHGAKKKPGKRPGKKALRKTQHHHVVAHRKAGAHAAEARDAAANDAPDTAAAPDTATTAAQTTAAGTRNAGGPFQTFGVGAVSAGDAAARSSAVPLALVATAAPATETATGAAASDDTMMHKVSSQASDLVVNALSFLGVRYKYGGERPSRGFDCSGFVRHVYQETVGLVLPHNAAEQSREGVRVAENELRPGDLVFFNTLRRAFSHVGIYIGNGEFIHAPRTGERVQIGSLDSPYWAKRFDGARRVINRATDPLLPSAQAAGLPDASADAPPGAADPTPGAPSGTQP